MVVSLLFLRASSGWIWGGIALLVLIFPLLMLVVPYETGWIFRTYEYPSFWTVSGFLRNLLYNGFHPVIPWTAFMLFGLWLGKQDLYDDSFVKRAFRIGLVIFLVVQGLALGVKAGFGPENDLVQVFNTEPMPPLPLYMINGMSIALVIITGCIWLGRKYENNWLILALNRTGKLALTFYVAHVILGMGLVEGFGSRQLGTYPLEFSVGYALFFSLLCVGFAQLWLRFKNMGPLEWVMRKLTD
ncbi:MAG: DUF418 domain-containing protein [Bacteroidota bacterium]